MCTRQVPTVFYRAVAPTEYQDYEKCGQLRNAPSGTEGKHLWDSIDNAIKFGLLVRQVGMHKGEFYVLEVQFVAGIVGPPYENSQDGIGPAYFVDENALKSIVSVKMIRTIPENEQ